MSTDLPKLIGLYSPAPRSGKSTAAEYLSARHGYEVRSFASPLKEMLAPLLVNGLGLTVEQAAAALYGEDKNKPLPLIGKTARQCLQTLGTEWGRGLVSESIWTDIAIATYAREGKTSVFDDMRFPNEMQAVRDAGGVCICIVRPGVENGESHASEGALNQEHFDAYIVNSGSVEDMHEKIDAALRNLHRPARTRDFSAIESAQDRLRMLQEYEAAFGLAQKVIDTIRRCPAGGLAAEMTRPEAAFEITDPGAYLTRDGRLAIVQRLDEDEARAEFDFADTGVFLVWDGLAPDGEYFCWARDGRAGPRRRAGPRALDLVEGPL